MDQTQLRPQQASVSAAVDIFTGLRKHFERLDGNAIGCYLVLWDMAGSRPGSLADLELSDVCKKLKRSPRTVEDYFKVLAGYRLLELGQRTGDLWPVRVISWLEAVRAYHLNEAPRDEDPQQTLFETNEPAPLPTVEVAEPRLVAFPILPGEYRAVLPERAGNAAQNSPGNTAQDSPDDPIEKWSAKKIAATREMLGDLKAITRGRMTRDEALARGSLSLDSKTKPRSVFDSQESNTDPQTKTRQRAGNAAQNSPPSPAAVDFAAVAIPPGAPDPASIVAEIQAVCPQINAGLARRAAAAVVVRQLSIGWLRDLLARLPAESPWNYFKASLTSEMAKHTRDPPKRR